MEFKLVDVNRLRKFKDVLLNIINNKHSELRGLLSSNASSSNKCPSASEVVSSISTAIADAINELDYSDSAVSNKYVASVSEENGKISVTRGNLPTFSYNASTGALTITN